MILQAQLWLLRQCIDNHVSGFRRQRLLCRRVTQRRERRHSRQTCHNEHCGKGYRDRGGQFRACVSGPHGIRNSVARTEAVVQFIGEALAQRETVLECK
jgi:hypothetical protein